MYQLIQETLQLNDRLDLENQICLLSRKASSDSHYTATDDDVKRSNHSRGMRTGRQGSTKMTKLINPFQWSTMILTTYLFIIMIMQTTEAAPSVEAFLLAEREIIAKEWAPLVWLHSNENFYPGSVINFLQHVKTSKQRGHHVLWKDGDHIILPTLPIGPAGRDTYLLASYNKDCYNCLLPKFLYGKKPGKEYSPPTYAIVHSCSHSEESKRINRKVHDSHQGFLNDESDASYASPSIDTLPDQITLNTSTSEPDEQSIYDPALQSTSTPIADYVTTTDKSYSNPKSQTDDPEEQFMENNITESSTHSSFQYRKINESKFQLQPKDDQQFTKTSVKPTSHVVMDKTEMSSNQNITTEDYQNVQSKNLLNDQEIDTERDKPTTSLIDENIHLTPIKDKKRHAIYRTYQQFSVTYWMFYPYNYGKDICTANLGFFGRLPKPTVGGICYGENIPMGNHVGDWEHITIQFQGRTPTRLYISSHNFGAFYTYNPQRHEFQYASQDTRKGVNMSPKYPPNLTLQGNHPIVYAAQGSHGLWPSEGKHHYNSFPSLEDETQQGTQWHTWKNLEIMDLQRPHTLASQQTYWLSYEGRWGNPSSKCHTLMGGFCEINHGPTGIPLKRINFPCHS